MKKLFSAFLALTMSVLAVLSGCSREYVIGKDISPDDVYYIAMGHGSMNYGQTYNFWVYNSRKKGAITLSASYSPSYDEPRIEFEDVPISAEEWQRFMIIIDGATLAKEKTPRGGNIMDGESQSITVSWRNGPSGNFHLDCGKSPVWGELYGLFTELAVKYSGEAAEN